ncbi:MAG: YHS domain-containing protein [Bacteroidia bacterium]
MKKYYLPAALIVFTTIVACSVFKTPEQKFAVDPVCNIKVDERDAYSYEYNKQQYYFDTYNCKETFKMNPDTYLKRKDCNTK